MPSRMLCELSQFGLIRFSGEEAQNFLHNQLTCDVNALTLDTSTYGAYCTPKGRMLASFLLWRSEQGYYMQIPTSLREAVQKKLSMFILRAKVKAEDASNDWVKLGVAGEDADLLIEKSLCKPPRAVYGVAHRDGMSVIRLPVDRYEIVCPKHKAPGLMESLSESTEVVNVDYWNWLAIRAGVPVILPATQDQLVPQMANLDLIGGLSFSKGCYPGQEIVARMHYLGRLKQRMYLANIHADEAPQPGDKLFFAGLGEQSSGMIVNAARAPEGGYDVLAVIQMASAEGGDVHWKSLGGPALEFLPLPYKTGAGDR